MNIRNLKCVKKINLYWFGGKDIAYMKKKGYYIVEELCNHADAAIFGEDDYIYDE